MDRNHNGEFDICDSDGEVYRLANTDLEELASRFDTTLVRVRFSNDDKMIVWYVVAKADDGQWVSIDLVDGVGRSINLRHVREPHGVHQLNWVPMSPSGARLYEGNYKLNVKIGSHALVQGVAWRQGRH